MLFFISSAKPSYKYTYTAEQGFGKITNQIGNVLCIVYNSNIIKYPLTSLTSSWQYIEVAERLVIKNTKALEFCKSGEQCTK